MTYGEFEVKYPLVIAQLNAKMLKAFAAYCSIVTDESKLTAKAEQLLDQRDSQSGIVDMVEEITDLQIGVEAKVLNASLANMPLKRKLSTETIMLKAEGQIVAAVLSNIVHFNGFN